MKKLLISFFGLMLAVSAVAQTSNYVVVDSEKVYKSIAKYNQAIISLDNTSSKYQAEVDAMYADIEKKFQSYQSQKASLSQSSRVARETEIIALEKKAKQLQESYFGEEGALEKKREELISPIALAVNSVISGYAKSNGYLMVLDKNIEASFIYVADLIDKTDEIIKLINQ